jgi:ABC-type nickel/cobalt efflux system permease component RcnA
VSKQALTVLFALCLALAASSWGATSALSDADSQRGAVKGQVEPGALDRTVAWVWNKQREFHRRLTRELGGLKEKEGSAFWLVLVSFLYGIFHAAGPGHGKAVLTTYLLTHGREVRRGIGMASAAALMQGITAVVLVYGLILLAGWLPRETHTAVDWTERFSFLLVTSIGGYLLWRGIHGIRSSLHRSDSDSLSDEHDPHDIQPDQIKKAKSWSSIFGVVFAIGLRPCSGAVLLLIFAHVMHIYWAGLAAVLAMSAGTAITVSTLALLAVNARQWVLAFADRTSSRWWGVGGGMTILLAGSFIFYLGLSLLTYSFGPKHPLGL